MSNKKFLQFIAALMILIFHLWFPVTRGLGEEFLIKTGYIGVDIFFFASAFSLADKEIQYGKLIKNRFVSIYLKFVLFVLVAAIYKHMQFVKIIKAITMIDLFEKGGGAFLWFAPAIFLFYLVYPFFVKWDNKYKVVIVGLVWFVLSVLVGTFTGYTKIFVFTNRVPAILVGFLFKRKSIPKWFSISCFPVGIVLLYLFGFKNKLNVPFDEFYFVLGIFFVIGIAGISSFIKPSKIWDILSAGTLELYGLQMIFGTKLVMTLYRITKNALLTNMVMLVVMFTASILLSKLYSFFVLRISNAIKSAK